MWYLKLDSLSDGSLCRFWKRRVTDDHVLEKSLQPQDRLGLSSGSQPWFHVSLTCKDLKFQIPSWTPDQLNQLCVLSCSVICNPIDCSSPGSSVHGTFQARILEWVAMPSSRGSSQLRDPTQVSRIAGRPFTIWVTRVSNSGTQTSVFFKSPSDSSVKRGLHTSDFEQGLADSFCQRPDSIFGFMGHRVSVGAIPGCLGPQKQPHTICEWMSVAVC